MQTTPDFRKRRRIVKGRVYTLPARKAFFIKNNLL